MTEHTPFEVRNIHGGIQNLFRFENGYGASVVKYPFSYGGESGLWELAVLKFDGDKFYIKYATEITYDVIGWMTDEDVDSALNKIKEL